MVGVAGGLQLPALAALAPLVRHPSALYLLAALISAPFLLTVRTIWDQRPRSRLHLYLGLWPFFAWWTFCLVMTVYAPLALLVTAIAKVPYQRSGTIAAAAAALSALFTLRRRPRVRRIDVPLKNLPVGFDGLRIAQISDLHCGPFTSQRRIARWVSKVNALRPDVVAVTGDLITSGSDFISPVATALGRLSAPLGVFACLGNHDYFGVDGTTFTRELERNHLAVLRNRHVVLTRGGGQLVMAGVDDTWTGRADVGRALAGRPAECPVVLLAHDPELFPEAARRDVGLTLSGHTHAGQLAIPGLTRRFNLARVMSHFTAGHYTLGEAQLYVNAGLGTTGPPIRIGARPEITVFTLRPARTTQRGALALRS